MGSSTEDIVPALCSPQELSCTVELDVPGSVPSLPHLTLSSGTERNWQGGRTGFSPPGDHLGATQPWVSPTYAEEAHQLFTEQSLPARTLKVN